MKALTRFISHLLISLLTIFGLHGLVLAAPNASLGLSVSASSVNPDQTVKVSVSVTPSEFAAGSIRIKLLYDANILEYQSFDDSSSAFDTKLISNTATAGVFSMSRGRTGEGLAGSGKVVDITFMAKTTGTAQISFDADSHIWESGTGSEKPLDHSATASVSVAAASAPSGGSSSSGSGSSSGSSGSQPSGSSGTTNNTTTTKKPTTAKPVTKATATPKPAATTAATATPTPAATATPSVDISSTQSTVTVSDVTAVADGVDTITVTAIVRSADGTIVTDATPNIGGLRDSESVTPFEFDSTTQTWSAELSSTSAGDINILVSAGGVDLATQDLTFTEAPVGNAEQTAQTGSSFGLIVGIGLLVLLILLFLLFLLWRRLHRNDNDDEDITNGSTDQAFPGEAESGAENAPAQAPANPPASEQPAAIPAAPAQPEEAVGSFNPDQALLRNTEVPPPPADQNQDDSIPL